MNITFRQRPKGTCCLWSCTHCSGWITSLCDWWRLPSHRPLVSQVLLITVVCKLSSWCHCVFDATLIHMTSFGWPKSKTQRYWILQLYATKQRIKNLNLRRWYHKKFDSFSQSSLDSVTYFSIFCMSTYLKDTTLVQPVQVCAVWQDFYWCHHLNMSVQNIDWCLRKYAWQQKQNVRCLKCAVTRWSTHLNAHSTFQILHWQQLTRCWSPEKQTAALLPPLCWLSEGRWQRGLSAL